MFQDIVIKSELTPESFTLEKNTYISQIKDSKIRKLINFCYNKKNNDQKFFRFLGVLLNAIYSQRGLTTFWLSRTSFNKLLKLDKKVPENGINGYLFVEFINWLISNEFIIILEKPLSSKPDGLNMPGVYKLVDNQILTIFNSCNWNMIFPITEITDAVRNIFIDDSKMTRVCSEVCTKKEGVCTGVCTENSPNKVGVIERCLGDDTDMTEKCLKDDLEVIKSIDINELSHETWINTRNNLLNRKHKTPKLTTTDKELYIPQNIPQNTPLYSERRKKEERRNRTLSHTKGNTYSGFDSNNELTPDKSTSSQSTSKKLQRNMPQSDTPKNTAPTIIQKQDTGQINDSLQPNLTKSSPPKKVLKDKITIKSLLLKARQDWNLTRNRIYCLNNFFAAMKKIGYNLDDINRSEKDSLKNIFVPDKKPKNMKREKYDSWNSMVEKDLQDAEAEVFAPNIEIKHDPNVDVEYLRWEAQRKSEGIVWIDMPYTEEQRKRDEELQKELDWI